MPRPRMQRFGDGLPTPDQDRRGLWAGIADTLRRAILSGSIPPGANLVEADLAQRFEVSRGPIRDALRELAREGLAVDLPRRGTVVSTLTFTDLQEVYSIREGLEVAASQWAIERATDADIDQLSIHVARMESAWQRGAEYSDSLTEDLGFHRALVALSGNGRIVRMYEQMLSQTLLLARTAARANPQLQLGMAPSAHRDIHQALVARDLAGLRLAVSGHYAYAQERLFDGLETEADQAPADPSTS